MIAAGQDAGEELSRAREALVAADAKLFLADVDELTESAARHQPAESAS
jgi:hypothetical protein